MDRMKEEIEARINIDLVERARQNENKKLNARVKKIEAEFSRSAQLNTFNHFESDPFFREPECVQRNSPINQTNNNNMKKIAEKCIQQHKTHIHLLTCVNVFVARSTFVLPLFSFFYEKNKKSKIDYYCKFEYLVGSCWSFFALLKSSISNGKLINQLGFF